MIIEVLWVDHIWALTAAIFWLRLVAKIRVFAIIACKVESIDQVMLNAILLPNWLAKKSLRAFGSFPSVILWSNTKRNVSVCKRAWEKSKVLWKTLHPSSLRHVHPACSLLLVSLGIYHLIIDGTIKLQNREPSFDVTRGPINGHKCLI